MKKILSAVLATAMTFSIAAAAFAAPIYEADESLKNTITGFSGSVVSIQQDVTQVGGKVSIPFDLGENAEYYTVEIDVKEGGKHIDAEYNKSKKAIILRPDVDVKMAEPEIFEIAVSVHERKGGDMVAEGFSITGHVSYDEVQEVEDGSRYNNSRGVLYDFGSGASDVEIYVNGDVTLNIKKSPRGIQNLHVTDDQNESIDYMFSGHSLTYLNFVGKPKFSTPVKVTLDADEDLHLYEYAGGELRKVNAEYDESAGFVFSANQLETYILADMPLTEGVVHENINTIKPGKPGSGSGSSNGDVGADKNNPTTGAPDMLGAAALAVAAAVSVGAALSKKRSK